MEENETVSKAMAEIAALKSFLEATDYQAIKHADGVRCFLCKGKEKVTAEFALSALAYNLRRAIRLCGGVPKLIELYRRTAMPKIRKIAEF